MLSSKASARQQKHHCIAIFNSGLLFFLITLRNFALNQMKL